MAGTKGVGISGIDTAGISNDMRIVRNAYGRKNADRQLRISADVAIDSIIRFLDE
jgi:hypothetical protein